MIAKLIFNQIVKYIERNPEVIYNLIEKFMNDFLAKKEAEKGK